jgi:hypothetical protein
MTKLIQPAGRGTILPNTRTHDVKPQIAHQQSKKQIAYKPAHWLIPTVNPQQSIRAKKFEYKHLIKRFSFNGSIKKTKRSEMRNL